jgi:hypothetical protein
MTTNNQKSKALWPLFFYVDNQSPNCDAHVVYGISKIRQNWRTIEEFYGFNLQMNLVEEKTGTFTVFLCGQYKVFMELNPREDDGKMIFVNSEDINLPAVRVLLDRELLSPNALKVDHMPVSSDQSLPTLSVQFTQNSPLSIVR